MRLNRREWSVALFGSVSVLTACATTRRSRPALQSVWKVSDGELSRELAVLAERPYSEAGIPVFLFGENLNETASPLPNAVPGTTSAPPNQTDLRKAFEQLAEAIARIRPKPAPDDVALLVEWLAERDFGSALASNGGKP
ncbi:MAG: hypothetical protein IT581_05795 [Verrucomicrobiales bacterium]|nr:hypothetical protein [Verrucomicrobiales bacterium]